MRIRHMEKRSDDPWILGCFQAVLLHLDLLHIVLVVQVLQILHCFFYSTRFVVSYVSVQINPI